MLGPRHHTAESTTHLPWLVLRCLDTQKLREQSFICGLQNDTHCSAPAGTACSVTPRVPGWLAANYCPTRCQPAAPQAWLLPVSALLLHLSQTAPTADHLCPCCGPAC